MSRKELNCLNSIIASSGVYFTIEDFNNKFMVVLNNNGVVSCGVISSNMMTIRQWIINKINKIRG